MNKKETINNILANFKGPLPYDLVSGQLCGLACEVCPLRAWKSPSMAAITCDQLLVATRRHQTLSIKFLTVIQKLKPTFDFNAKINIGDPI